MKECARRCVMKAQESQMPSSLDQWFRRGMRKRLVGLRDENGGNRRHIRPGWHQGWSLEEWIEGQRRRGMSVDLWSHGLVREGTRQNCSNGLCVAAELTVPLQWRRSQLPAAEERLCTVNPVSTQPYLDPCHQGFGLPVQTP
jgi:hypothetical protein